MLQIIRSFYQLHMEQLFAVYAESIRISAREHYPHETEYNQIMRSQQDVEEYARQFFSVPGSFYALWLQQEQPVSVLRMEPYRDGYLLTGLETHPGHRGRGNATLLLSAVLEHLQKEAPKPVYSHVHKRNLRSLAVHQKCGFTPIHDHAVFLDGSVSHNSYTFCCYIS